MCPLGRGTAARLVCLFHSNELTISRPSAGLAWRVQRWVNLTQRAGRCGGSARAILCYPARPQSSPPSCSSCSTSRGCISSRPATYCSPRGMLATAAIGSTRGLLKVMGTSTRGEERIVAILGPGAVVGELAMVDRRPQSASVVAARDSVLRFISREAYEKRVLAHPETKQALLEILAFRLRRADEELAATTFLSAKARVARALLELAKFVGKPSGSQCIVLEEKIGLADLAAMAGVARENASRVLSEWRRRNLVLIGVSQGYVLNDAAALKREMNED